MADPGRIAQRIDRPRYRRRRLEDLARVLPVLGVGLFLLPVLWSNGGGVALGRMLIYLFGAWFALIVLTFLLSRRLGETAPDDPRDERDDDL